MHEKEQRRVSSAKEFNKLRKQVHFIWLGFWSLKDKSVDFGTIKYLVWNFYVQASALECCEHRIPPL